ncbi:hypothetical protein ACWCQ0_44230, partial [Streptomyces massasporeus]
MAGTIWALSMFQLWREEYTVTERLCPQRRTRFTRRRRMRAVLAPQARLLVLERVTTDDGAGALAALWDRARPADGARASSPRGLGAGALSRQPGPEESARPHGVSTVRGVQGEDQEGDVVLDPGGEAT